jgi:hypothetical protein
MLKRLASSFSDSLKKTATGKSEAVMQNISVEYLTHANTKRARFLNIFLRIISNGLIAFGGYEVIQKSTHQDEAMAMVFENAIPAVFMTIGDTLFMELVATDVVLNFCSRLNIFNGFMERDEDLFVLVNMMGLEYLTGRGGKGVDSVHKDIHRPRHRSQDIHKNSGSFIPGRTQSQSSVVSRTLLTSEKMPSLDETKLSTSMAL